MCVFVCVCVWRSTGRRQPVVGFCLLEMQALVGWPRLGLPPACQPAPPTKKLMHAIA